MRPSVSAVSVRAVCVTFGGVCAVEDVSFDIPTGERRGFLGPNGAGKTTLFNLIGGQVPLNAGSVRLFDQDVTRMPVRERAHCGLSRTFQITKLFPNLTLRENAMLAVQAFHPSRYSMHRTVFTYRDIQRAVDELLDTWGLSDKAGTTVRHLSYGDQRQLEIVMALANKPRVLLLDEPTAGLSPAETVLVTGLVSALPRDITVLFIEHDMDVAFQIADRITVLNKGRIIGEGEPAEIRANVQIRDIYFGKMN